MTTTHKHLVNCMSVEIESLARIDKYHNINLFRYLGKVYFGGKGALFALRTSDYEETFRFTLERLGYEITKINPVSDKEIEIIVRKSFEVARQQFFAKAKEFIKKEVITK